MERPVRVTKPSSLRGWLVECCETGRHPGMRWVDEERTLIRIPWNHDRGSRGVEEAEKNIFIDYCRSRGILHAAGRELTAKECKNWLSSAIRHSQTVSDVSTKDNLSTPYPDRCRIIRLLPITVRSCARCDQASGTTAMLRGLREEAVNKFGPVGAGVRYTGAVGAGGEQCWMLRIMFYYYGDRVGEVVTESSNGIRVLPLSERRPQGHICAAPIAEQALVPEIPGHLAEFQAEALRFLDKDLLRGLAFWADPSGIYIRWLGHSLAFVQGNVESTGAVAVLSCANACRAFNLVDYMTAMARTSPDGAALPQACVYLYFGGVPTPEGGVQSTVPLIIQLWHECLWRALSAANV
ncbi:R8 [Macaca mulatta rhadinovirus 17577]|uniref:VIRF n=2 Tax=Macacine gammaherpesvirus 5 TaxID=154334 RepID=Q77NI4_9GAMA|nr:R8 [Macacine gammaherpesvirus 5]AAD21386.1 R8 [Macaca mulatta rhadinovirus 17577]AAF60038.1 vIRF [Rhesus monkey rhadinovirus H26-95]WUF06352.1 R8 [synthetic construct]WVG99661.1 R8 [Macaca mulatta rhadinovirus]QFN51670.1 ORF R8 [Macacine gammaherpesvirus 5]